MDFLFRFYPCPTFRTVTKGLMLFTFGLLIVAKGLRALLRAEGFPSAPRRTRNQISYR